MSTHNNSIWRTAATVLFRTVQAGVVGLFAIGAVGVLVLVGDVAGALVTALFAVISAALSEFLWRNGAALFAAVSCWSAEGDDDWDEDTMVRRILRDRDPATGIPNAGFLVAHLTGDDVVGPAN